MTIAMRPQAEAARSLRAGDWVEVRSAAEILATLDEQACLDGLPFMPEMLRHCGQRFRVSKSAHKTCDTVKSYKTLRLQNTVHLEQLRCDGAAHGGCQAGCLVFWKEAWLKPASAERAQPLSPGDGDALAPQDRERLRRGACRDDTVAEDKRVYRCQATQLPAAATPVRWWYPGPYVKDLTSGNVTLGVFLRSVMRAGWNIVLRRVLRDRNYPQVAGHATTSPASEPLNLQPGELVQVRSRREILDTLDKGRKHKNLWFDIEMERFCGGTYRVRNRVQRLIDEKTGRMIRISRDCIVLEDVTCSGRCSRDRMFCPRAIFPYWREAWLKRVQ
jgi:hypothetical protein